MSVILTKGHADARPFRHVADLGPFLTDAARTHALDASHRETETMLSRLRNGHAVNPWHAGEDVWHASPYALAVRENGRRMAGIVAGPVAL